jgi:uncharacterized protein
MTVYFADTSYYIALLVPQDDASEAAERITLTLKGTIVTTVWILTELGNFFSRQPHRTRCSDFIADLLNDPDVRVIPADAAVFNSGFQLYRQRADKEWSLTDCISFTVMTQMSIGEALTTDHHFEQAGFSALLNR